MIANIAINEKVWILAGQFADIPMQGAIKSITNIDNKGPLNTYCDVKTSHGLKHVNIAQIFKHRPEKILKEDCFGIFSTWK